MVKLVKLVDALAEQVASNQSAVGHERHFGDHRARLTAEIRARAPRGGQGRLCLLGAGNANDVDLEALAADFREVHLVDIDREAIERARARLSEPRRAAIFTHAPVEVSGLFDRLDEWASRPPGPEALAQAMGEAVPRVVGSLPGPFDVVASCCLITQLQLVLLEVIGDRSPSFDALRAALGRVHVRVLAALLAPGGVGLLVTDLTGSDTYPFNQLAPDADLGKLMSDLLSAGNVIHAAHPGRLSAEIRRDPAMAAAYDVGFPVGPWIWHNGPNATFLVYGLEIRSRVR